MTIDLQPFCADPEWNAGARHDMTKPWIVGAWRYATDARLIVRVPTEPGKTPDNVPDAVSLFTEFDPAKCTKELPDWDGSTYDYQEQCDYPQCHGGKISGGDRLCNVCEGKGWTAENMSTTVEFQGFNFNGELLQKIHSLPGVKGYVKLWTVGREDHGQLRFTFNNGGQGILMNITSAITTKGIEPCGK